jgi:N-acetylglucosaminyl-diphospho-decaprenol L-rhamnosyltransferase
VATDPETTSVSVVIVAWNSREELARTIPALLGELGEGDELVVVDNASSDDTAGLVRELAPAANLVSMSGNTGFAAGANAGAAAARGDLLVLLNPDAVPQPGWGEAIRRPAADGRGWSAWMSLVTAERGRVVNTFGGALHFTGIAWAGGAGDPVPVGLAPAEVPFLSGACLAIPRATWERAGGFCERYFLYHEDVDLSLRLRLEGGAIGLEPSAVVDHDYQFGGAGKYRYLERNRWSTVLRDYPGPLLALLTPALLATELALIAVSVAGGWGRQKWDANLDVLRALGPTLRERRRIQGARDVSAGEFAAFLTPDLDSAYLGRAASFAPLRWGLRAYWKVVRLLLRAPDRSALPEG